MRPSNKRSRSKSNRPRPLGNIINRVFDSSGPEGKVRGTPQQIIDKYLVLARDAQLSNDRVAAENFLQHAEHYTRMLGEAQRELARETEMRREQMPQQGQHNRRQDNDGGDSEPRDERRDDGQNERRNERREDPRPEGERRDDARRDDANRANRREPERRDNSERNRGREHTEQRPPAEPMSALETESGSMLVETPESRADAGQPAAAGTEAQPAPKPRNRRAPKRKPAADSAGGEGGANGESGASGEGGDTTNRDAAE